MPIQSMPTSRRVALRPPTKYWWSSSVQAYISPNASAQSAERRARGGEDASFIPHSDSASRKDESPRQKYKNTWARLRMLSPKIIFTSVTDCPGGTSMPRMPKNHLPNPVLTPDDCVPFCEENIKIVIMTAAVKSAERIIFNLRLIFITSRQNIRTFLKIMLRAHITGAISLFAPCNR